MEIPSAISSACCVCVIASVGFIAYDSTKTTTPYKAKTWPEVVGMDIDAAITYIESQPGGLYVQKFPDTHVRKYPDTMQAFTQKRITTMDIQHGRVRVIYNQQTRRVTKVPING